MDFRLTKPLKTKCYDESVLISEGENAAMLVRNHFEGSYWLDRIDEYAPGPKVYFGVGTLNTLGKIARDLTSCRKCVVITDEALFEFSFLDHAKNMLTSEGFTVECHLVPIGEPTLDEVEHSIEAVRALRPDLIVGIGGGAVMDIAKCVAVMLETPGQLQDYLLPSTTHLVGSVPKILIPTTSGTGSEYSNSAVVNIPHEDMERVKSWICGEAAVADVAIVDPRLTVTLPPKLTAGSGMDALSHCAEAVLSVQANPFSDALALKGVELAAKNLRTAYHQGESLEARWNMALASTIGGMVIGLPWVAGPAILAHVASEGISAKYSIPHGEACGVLLPYAYWYNLPDAYGQRKLASIAKAMGEDTHSVSIREAAKKALHATFSLLEDVDLPTSLSEYDIPYKDLDYISHYIEDRAEEINHMSKYNPRKATRRNLRDFFDRAFHGKETVL